jgi:hypothetical protein
MWWASLLWEAIQKWLHLDSAWSCCDQGQSLKQQASSLFLDFCKRGRLYVQRMKVYVYKLCTIFTCVLCVLSTDLYVFLHTGGSMGTPFFRQAFFWLSFLFTNWYTTNSIVNMNSYTNWYNIQISICIHIRIMYKPVYTNLYEIIYNLI